MRFVKKWSFASANHIAGVMHESHQKRFCYYYGFQIIYGELVKSIILLGAAYFMGIFVPVLLILINFATLRMVAGGYHMDTYGRCMFVSMIMFLGAGVIAQYTYQYWNMFGTSLLTLATFVISLYAVIKYAPKDTPNKPITEAKEIRKFKLLSVCYLFMWLIIMLTPIVYELNRVTLSLDFAVLLEVFTITPAGEKFFGFIRKGMVRQSKRTRLGGNCGIG